MHCFKRDKEDGNQRRRKITLHSFRRFLKTTISDLGYADFFEWFIGHSGSAALEGGDTKGGGGFADDGATHPGCGIAIDDECFNQPVGS